MSNNSRLTANFIAPTSIAAAMLMAGPAFAADGDAAAADAEVAARAKEGIQVNGERRKMELPTIRGPVIDVPQIVTTVSSE
ncbi:MAG TPA: hypothetical protein VJM79_00750, partial [Rhizorhapis sp.]|nr:hypothetical protein [Rhizorhapis sp.]